MLALDVVDNEKLSWKHYQASVAVRSNCCKSHCYAHKVNKPSSFKSTFIASFCNCAILNSVTSSSSSVHQFQSFDIGLFHKSS
jgi:hypothetical protein